MTYGFATPAKPSVDDEESPKATPVKEQEEPPMTPPRKVTPTTKKANSPEKRALRSSAAKP